MKIQPWKFIDGVFIVTPDVHKDERGFFSEIYKESEFKKAGLPTNFVQDNHSRSTKNVLRGLHFQWEPPMGKLMRVTLGAAALVAVDIRIDSKTFGEYAAIVATAENKRQLFAPAGFARGFYVISDVAEIQYKCTGEYNKTCESGILWNDPELGIFWPSKNPILSEKDEHAQTLREWLNNPKSKEFKI